MRNKICTVLFVIAMAAGLAACGGETETLPADLPAEKIQIDVATDEFLNTFDNLYRANIRVPEQDEGETLVIWANFPLFNFNVTALFLDWPDGSDEPGFRATDSFGSVHVLLPGEAFVIENYVGAGTFPSRGISFTDENGENARVFFFQQNQAYPEYGGRWIIREIEADLLVWGSASFGSVGTPMPFEPFDGDYAIVVNGAGFDGYTYTIPGAQHPTHVSFGVIHALGLSDISGGSQISLQYNGEGIGVALSVVNYLAFGDDRVPVGINDTFMADDGWFTVHIPVSLLRHLGFDVHFEGERVHISGQLDVAVNPHPLAVALEHFIHVAAGETRAHVVNIGGNVGVLAIEIIDGFAEATLFTLALSEVSSYEIGSIEGFPFSVGVTTDGWGSLVKLTGDGGNRSYTMFTVTTDPTTIREEIIPSFTIYAERRDDGSINYYRFNGGWLEGIEGGRHPVTEEEFYEIRRSMGDDIISWRDLTFDSTESILQWVSTIW
ncbi:MAG: hypothetical protein FWC70_05895 [Defluviitaleaceae bacterium]|nr:hypothetical protein [Defluviitaleaceae bacterium]